MRSACIDAALVTSMPNIFYFSGFTGTNAVLFISAGAAYLLTDFRYIEQARTETTGFEILRTDGDFIETTASLSSGLKKIGIEDSLQWKTYHRVQQAITPAEVVDATALLQQLREIKEDAEIEIIREAVQITDRAFAHILKYIHPGVTEQDIALELEFFQRKLGASGRSFDFIVASGERSALPHGVATDKKIARGELLTMDFGAKYKGYCSDFTRTVMIGHPEPKHQELYAIVRAAQQAGLDAVRPGITGKEADAAARQIIAEAGYGDYFGHGLGHALGIEIHETPRLSPKEDKILEPGMILTVEPGIYLPGWGGIRIEDVVFVTNNGAEVLTQASKQFIIID